MTDTIQKRWDFMPAPPPLPDGKLHWWEGLSIQEVRNSQIADRVYGNRFITVTVKRDPDVPDWPPIYHLQVIRHNRQRIGADHFNVLQGVKNELFGPDWEAVEIYPADDRLHDRANVYHLYVFNDPTFRLPFGMQRRFAPPLGMTRDEYEKTRLDVDVLDSTDGVSV